MEENRVMDQINAIFSVFMVIFYLGVGVVLIFFIDFYDKAVRVMMGGTFLFYGVYRGFRTYNKIVELFFSKKKEDE